MANLDDVLTYWQNNIAFRKQFKINPEAALNAANLQVTPEELSKIKALLKLREKVNEELEKKINK